MKSLSILGFIYPSTITFKLPLLVYSTQTSPSNKVWRGNVSITCLINYFLFRHIRLVERGWNFNPMENEGIVSNRLRCNFNSGNLIYKSYHNIYDLIIVNFQYDGTVERPTCVFLGRLFKQGVYPTVLGWYF